MGKDYGDDDIFELTEDMASFIPPPPEKSGKAEETEANGEIDGEPGDGSVDEEEPAQEAPNRPSYIPRYSDVPVVTTPIRKLDGRDQTAETDEKPETGDEKRDEPEDKAEGDSQTVGVEENTGKDEAVEEADTRAEGSVTEAAVEPAVYNVASTTATLQPRGILELAENTAADKDSNHQADTAEKRLDAKEETLAPGVEQPAAEDEESAAAAEEMEETAEEEEKEGGSAREAVYDLGTPQAVFDSFASEEAAELEEEREASDEETEEIDLSGAVEITGDLGSEDLEKAGDEKEPGKTVESEDGDDTQEIDLNEAEELRITAPPPFVADEGAAARPPRIRRKRGRQKEWWAQIFDDDYLSLLPGNTARSDRKTVDFVEKSLGLASNGLVLDLACGNGRHAVDMAKRGYRMVGIDLSLPMLALAGELAQEAEQKINFIHGDMRDLGFDSTFDAVYCIGTSFGYFDETTNFKVLEGIARSLKPGAPFLLEVANRDYVISQVPQLTWFEGNGSVCMEETHFNFINSRLYVARQLIMENEGRQVKHELSLRLYSLHELGLMLHNAGFKVSQVSGSMATPGAFFGPDSARSIILAESRK